MKFILHDHITSAGWSDRHHLFNGHNAYVVKMNYLQAIPLMFRFFVMYLHEFWLIFAICLFALFYSFWQFRIEKSHFVRLENKVEQIG